MTIIESLTADQIEKLHHSRELWSNPARTEGADRTAAENALTRIYEHIGLKRPNFIWCDSIFQYVAIKGMIFLLAVDDSGRLSSALETQLTDPMWSTSWQSLNNQLKKSPETLELIKANFEQIKAGKPMPQSEMGTSSLMEQIGNSSVRTKIDIAIADATNKLEKSIPDLLGIRAKLQIRAELYTRLRAEARQLVRAQFSRSVGTMIAGNMKDQFLSQLSEETKEEVENKCKAYLSEKESILANMFGTANNTKPASDLLFQDALNEQYSLIEDPRFSSSHSLPSYSFIIELLQAGLDEKAQECLRNYLSIKKGSIEFQPFKGLCIVCEAPQTFMLNQRNFLHNAEGPAMTFRDGYKVYAMNGVTIASKLLDDPRSITIEEIAAEQNVELRRIMIQQYGVERYTEDSGARVIDSDEFGVLYKKEQQSDEPIVIVKVTNATPEPDGTGPKQYFLRVPPYIVTAKEAVAWTFNMPNDEYKPSEQS